MRICRHINLISFIGLSQQLKSVYTIYPALLGFKKFKVWTILSQLSLLQLSIQHCITSELSAHFYHIFNIKQWILFIPVNCVISKFQTMFSLYQSVYQIDPLSTGHFFFFFNEIHIA